MRAVSPGFSARIADAPSEAAPARYRVRFLALGLMLVLLVLCGRAIQLAFAGDPLAGERAAALSTNVRADIVDRNGVLLATTVRAFALTATPSRVWNAEETASALIGLYPELDRATLLRRLTDSEHQLVYLRRGLTPEEREAVMALGLAGIGFESEAHRRYPQETLAAHVVGFTDVDLKPLAGVERGLDVAIREAGASGRPVRISLDVRLQYALETELDAGARRAGASGAAGVIMDGRSGEVLALASWPAFDPNEAGDAPARARRDRAGGDVHELGSTIKPFTVAMALQERVTRSGESFDVSRPFMVSEAAITDHEPLNRPASLSDIIAHSSNIGAAQLALRLGATRQRGYLDRLGLTAPTRLETGRNEAPLAPQVSARRDIASLGFGYGLAATPAALAGAYSVFTNQGARVEPTFLARAPSDEVTRAPVFTPQVTARVLSYMRAAVTEGTGRAAEVPGLALAGKTGTAEKRAGAAGYDESRNFSSFAGVFPGADPRYVIVVALDDVGAGESGGAVAAPVVGATLRRAAPLLGLSVARPE